MSLPSRRAYSGRRAAAVWVGLLGRRGLRIRPGAPRRQAVRVSCAGRYADERGARKRSGGERVMEPRTVTRRTLSALLALAVALAPFPSMAAGVGTLMPDARR